MTKRKAGPKAADQQAAAAGDQPACVGTGMPTESELGLELGPLIGDAGGAQGASAADPESETVAYLNAHPDFFARHPDVLVGLRIQHDSGAAVSLIEHQVSVLRRQLDTERSRLAHLIARARDYESLSTRHHDLILHLIPVDGLDRLGTVLNDGLRRELNAEAVTLKLFPIDAADPDSARHDPLVTAFGDFLTRSHALCGPLDPEQGATLFGAQGAGLHSAVLIPIRADGRSGVLAIGAADPDRFGPEMRTDLLDRLGEIVSAKLQTLTADLPAALAPAAVQAVQPKPKRKPRTKTGPAPTALARPSAQAVGPGTDGATPPVAQTVAKQTRRSPPRKGKAKDTSVDGSASPVPDSAPGGAT